MYTIVLTALDGHSMGEPIVFRLVTKESVIGELMEWCENNKWDDDHEEHLEIVRNWDGAKDIRMESGDGESIVVLNQEGRT